MYFNSLQALLYMDGHGVYVWFCYAVVLLFLIVLVVYPLQKKRKALLAIKQRALFQQEKRYGNE